MNEIDASGINKDKAQLYCAVFNTPQGREVLDDLINMSGFYIETWNPDPYVTSYNCGQRRFVGRILNLVGQGHAIDEISRRMQEKIDE